MDDRVTRIEASEASADLPSLLRKVAEGREYIITDHGKPVARVSPDAGKDPEAEKPLVNMRGEPTTREKIDEAIAKIREMQKRHTLGGLSWKELRDEGRKW